LGNVNIKEVMCHSTDWL